MQCDLTQLRDRTIRRTQFRRAAHSIALHLAQQVYAQLSQHDDILLVPILRSGLAMLPAFLQMFPQASVGLLGMKRTEDTVHTYLENLPTITPQTKIILLDPMLATGTTANAAIQHLLNNGAIAKNIVFISMISAPEGTHSVHQQFPHVHILCAVQDSHLDENKYIVPGLGDFGDRYFGT